MNFSFNAQRGPIVVWGQLFGSSGSIILRLALDTGATKTTINVAPLTAIGYDPSLAPDRVQVTTGSGVEFAPRVLVRSIQILKQKRNFFPVLAHTLPPTASVDGLLGLDFFRGQILTINFQRGIISLDQKPIRR